MMSRSLAKGKPNSFAARLITDLTVNLCSFDLHHELEIYVVCKLPFNDDRRVHKATNSASDGIALKGRIFVVLWLLLGPAVMQLVKALHYKPEGRGFDSRWCH